MAFGVETTGQFERIGAFGRRERERVCRQASASAKLPGAALLQPGDHVTLMPARLRVPVAASRACAGAREDRRAGRALGGRR